MKFQTTVTGVFTVDVGDIAHAESELRAVVRSALAGSERYEMTPATPAAEGDLALRRMYRDNLKTWVESMAVDTGTPEQKAKWLDQRLPRVELEALVRGELFRPFERVPRWERIRSTDLQHEAGCARRVLDTKIEYGDGVGGAGGGGLTRQAIERINLINAGLEMIKHHPWLLGNDEIMGGLRWHRVTCTRCNVSRFAHSYTVTIPWLDRVLSREYAL